MSPSSSHCVLSSPSSTPPRQRSQRSLPYRSTDALHSLRRFLQQCPEGSLCDPPDPPQPAEWMAQEVDSVLLTPQQVIEPWDPWWNLLLMMGGSEAVQRRLAEVWADDPLLLTARRGQLVLQLVYGMDNVHVDFLLRLGAVYDGWPQSVQEQLRLRYNQIVAWDAQRWTGRSQTGGGGACESKQLVALSTAEAKEEPSVDVTAVSLQQRKFTFVCRHSCGCRTREGTRRFSRTSVHHVDRHEAAFTTHPSCPRDATCDYFDPAKGGKGAYSPRFCKQVKQSHPLSDLVTRREEDNSQPALMQTEQEAPTGWSAAQHWDSSPSFSSSSSAVSVPVSNGGGLTSTSDARLDSSISPTAPSFVHHGRSPLSPISLSAEEPVTASHHLKKRRHERRSRCAKGCEEERTEGERRRHRRRERRSEHSTTHPRDPLAFSDTAVGTHCSQRRLRKRCRRALALLTSEEAKDQFPSSPSDGLRSAAPTTGRAVEGKRG